MIRVEREGRTLDRYRLSRYGRFLAEVATVEELAELGVPLTELVDEDDQRA